MTDMEANQNHEIAEAVRAGCAVKIVFADGTTLRVVGEYAVWSHD